MSTANTLKKNLQQEIDKNNQMVQERLDTEQNHDKSQINITQFETLKLLGKGSFGDVNLVRKKDTNKLYALKVIWKHNKTARVNFMDSVFNERDVLG